MDGPQQFLEEFPEVLDAVRHVGLPPAQAAYQA
jgi:hypothetical protein